MRIPMKSVLSTLAAALLAAAPAFAQQQGPGWFVPPAGGNAQPAQSRPATRPATVAPRPTAPLLAPPPPQAPRQEAEAPPAVPPVLPAPPDLPPLTRGNAPPASVIGVLSVPDVMCTSLAAQQIEKTITERRERLNEDAQKEQTAWRDLGQQLQAQRPTLTPEQIRTRERELQERVANAQKQFPERNRLLQETLQYGLAQIENTLGSVVRQVAESRGMNLVLHRAQVVLNVAEFDMTEQVADQLNKVLPTVVLPPEGVSPSTFAPPGSPPPQRPAAAASTPTPTATPAATPAPTPAPPRR